MLFILSEGQQVKEISHSFAHLSPFSVISQLVMADKWEKTFLGNALCHELLNISHLPPSTCTQDILHTYLLPEAFLHWFCPISAAVALVLSDFLVINTRCPCQDVFSAQKLIEF